MPTTLELQGISHRYGSHTVLDGVSLRVQEGDLYGFLGHNGAGKTTCMRIALGLIRPDSGTVRIDGFEARRYPLEARARVGALIEAPGFYRGMDGRRNLHLLARLQGMDRRSSRQEADRLLDLVGLAGAGRKSVEKYSQGMRQRLGVAQALLGSPRLVLLDEPLNGLDPEGIREMRELLLRLTRDEGITVFLSSHQLREISDLCNRIAVIREGRLLIEEETATLLEDQDRPYRIRVDAGAGSGSNLASILDAMGVSHEEAPSDILTLAKRSASEREGDETTMEGRAGGPRLARLGSVSPGDVARRVVEAGGDLVELSPKAPSLEEVYHRFTGSRTAAGGPESSESRPAAPAADPSAGSDAEADRVNEPRETIAPRRPLLRMIRHEFARWTANFSVPRLIVLPALLGAFAVYRRFGQAKANAEDVEQADVISTTVVTAFEGVAVGLQAGLPLLAFIVAGIASQSVTGSATNIIAGLGVGMYSTGLPAIVLALGRRPEAA